MDRPSSTQKNSTKKRGRASNTNRSSNLSPTNHEVSPRTSLRRGPRNPAESQEVPDSPPLGDSVSPHSPTSCSAWFKPWRKKRPKPKPEKPGRPSASLPKRNGPARKPYISRTEESSSSQQGTYRAPDTNESGEDSSEIENRFRAAAWRVKGCDSREAEENEMLEKMGQYSHRTDMLECIASDLRMPLSVVQARHDYLLTVDKTEPERWSSEEDSTILTKSHFLFTPGHVDLANVGRTVDAIKRMLRIRTYEAILQRFILLRETHERLWYLQRANANSNVDYPIQGRTESSDIPGLDGFSENKALEIIRFFGPHNFEKDAQGLLNKEEINSALFHMGKLLKRSAGPWTFCEDWNLVLNLKNGEDDLTRSLPMHIPDAVQERLTFMEKIENVLVAAGMAETLNPKRIWN